MSGGYKCLQGDPDIGPGPAQQELRKMPIGSSAAGPTLVVGS